MTLGRRQDVEIRRQLRKREAVYRRRGYDMGRAIRFVLRQARRLPGRVLEIGTGKGRFLVRLARCAARVVTVDLDPAEQRVARLNAAREGLGRRVRYVVADATRLPFADASFNAVVSFNVLHHLRDLEGVLDEVLRVIAPGGTIVLADFDAAGFRIFDRLLASEGRSHERFRYRWPHIVARIRAAGFDVRLLRAEKTVLALAGRPEGPGTPARSGPRPQSAPCRKGVFPLPSRS